MLIQVSHKARKIPSLLRCPSRTISIRQKIYDSFRLNFKDPWMLFYNDTLERSFDRRLPPNVIYHNPFVRFYSSFRAWLGYAGVFAAVAAFNGYVFLPVFYFSTLAPVLLVMPLPREDAHLVSNITVNPDTLEFKVTYGDNKEVKAFFEEVSIDRHFRPLLDELKVKGVDHSLLITSFCYHQFSEEAFVELKMGDIEKFADIVNVIDQELIDLDLWQKEVNKSIEEQKEK